MALSVEARGAEHQLLRGSPRQTTALTPIRLPGKLNIIASVRRRFETPRMKFSQTTSDNILFLTLSHACRETKCPNFDTFPLILRDVSEVAGS